MPTRKKSSTRKRTKRTKQRGRGIMSTIGTVAKFVKDHKLVSRGLGLIPHPGAQAVSTLAGMAGLGRRKRRPAGRATTRRRCVTLGHDHDLMHVVAATARKRKLTKRKGSLAPLGKTQVGRGIFSDLGGGIGSVAHGLFGNGRKKRSTKRRNVLGI